MTRIAMAAASVEPMQVLDIITRTGTGAARLVTTPIPLNTSGGLILTKNYNGSDSWALSDTARGVTRDLDTTTVAAETTQAQGVTSISATGFNLGTLAKRNGNGLLFTDYVMRQAPKFLQVISRASSGSFETVSHNLGVRPGFIIAKSRGTTNGWCVWHRYADAFNTDSSVTGLSLHSTAAARYVSYVEMTDSTFTTEIYGWDGTTQWVASTAGNTVFYVFAHDPSPSGVIQCGGYIGNGSASGPTINLGWTPRMLLIKCSTAAGNWCVFDTGRGLTASNDSQLLLNSATAQSTAQIINPTATGFQLASTDLDTNGNGQQYIYVAFR